MIFNPKEISSGWPEQRMSLQKHVAYVGRDAYRNVVGKPEGTKSHVRPWRRKKEDIKRTFKSSMDLINLAHDGDKLQAFGDTSVKIGAPWNAGNPRQSQKLSAYQEGPCCMDLVSVANVNLSFFRCWRRDMQSTESFFSAVCNVMLVIECLISELHRMSTAHCCHYHHSLFNIPARQNFGI